MSTPVEVFVDYVCSFCFLAEEAIKELQQERDVQVTIRPFELRPDPVPTLRPEDNYLPRVWQDAVYPMARRLNIPIRLPSISPQPRTHKAFVVLQLAQEQGKAVEYSNAMYRAFFQEDRGIGQDDVITDIAVSAGLKREEVRAALADPDRHTRQRQAQDYATNTVGVTSVPSFVINGRVLAGVPSAARLKKAVDEANAEGSHV